jgi:hypothetical protein
MLKKLLIALIFQSTVSAIVMAQTTVLDTSNAANDIYTYIQNTLAQDSPINQFAYEAPEHLAFNKEGEVIIWRWNFMQNQGFQGSNINMFTHFFQVKPELVNRENIDPILRLGLYNRSGNKETIEFNFFWRW